MDTGTLEVTAREDASRLTADSIRNYAPIDPDVFIELSERYSLRCLSCIISNLTRDQLRVIHDDEKLDARAYCSIARLERMSPAEVSLFSKYSVTPEYQHDFNLFNTHWMLRERNFVIERLRKKGKEPTNLEIENAHADEILDTGKSHSKRSRVCYALSHPDRVTYTGLDKAPTSLCLSPEVSAVN